MTTYLLSSTKKLCEVSLEETVFMHLSNMPRHRLQDFLIESCLTSAEFAMRQSRGIASTANYAPLLCGFAILDQLGCCYADSAIPNQPAPNKSGVIKALHNFGKYPSDTNESNAFYALRNFLVHDASLAGQTRKGDWYIFRYNWDMAEAISLPATPWDGTANTITNTTWINPRKFTDEISHIIEQVRAIMQNRPNDLVVKESKENILHKYLFWQ